MYPPIVTQCFKAYDVRGRVPAQLNEGIAYRIGRSLVVELQGDSFVVGQDFRLESPALAEGLMFGITASGADVIGIGARDTEEVYCAISHHSVDCGIMITASHNPKGYNGMRLVKAESCPIRGGAGIDAIRLRVGEGNLGALASKKSEICQVFDKTAYLDYLLTYVDISALTQLKIVADPGNGAGGSILKALTARLPFRLFINEAPDGHFPNSVPNPLLPENRELTQRALLANRCDIGLAWDGDFDRCFVFDAAGRFIGGHYLVGLLAQVLLRQRLVRKIIHDPRLMWNTIEQVELAGGVAIQSKPEHAFIKERMRYEGAVYGGEMSAHHYFRDLVYCDSGKIPWLLLGARMSSSGKILAQLVDKRIEAYPCPCPGEINYRVRASQKYLKSFRLFICCKLRKSIEQVVSVFLFRTGVPV